jgi:AAA+ ATPase superfamily predicted ATPase
MFLLHSSGRATFSIEATSLSRPLERLIEMDLVARETPFGTSVRSSKRTLYRIADPFLRFWFRFVQPDRSRLEARQLAAVERDVAASFPHHAGEVWEELARVSVPALEAFGRTWGPAGRWWGPAWIPRPWRSTSWPRVRRGTPS